MALDLGARRIGVAVSDPGGVLASPHTTVERSGDLDRDRGAIAAIVRDTGAERVVVGLPLTLAGAVGAAAEAAQAEAAALAAVLSVPVETYDERLTTVTAERSLRDAGVRGRARRVVIDQAAATVLLQAWLDGRRTQRTSPDSGAR